tara:strand:+ start:341 stop:1504 length:1164 start_codon:yes stop_codon:yes gene_type:complete
MKIKIAILGSTGSIGKSLLDVISKEKNNFEIQLLTANKNYKELIKQTKRFKVKNIIISDKKSYLKFLKLNKNKDLKVYDNFTSFKKIFNSKIDYTMSSIVGINGLYPTIDIIKYTKKIAISNKESIICAWNLIQYNLKKYKSTFVPVDSEHFSMWFGLKNFSYNNIDKIYLTASGGPFLNLSLKKFSKIKIEDAVNHPRWKMGRKISIDSATLMNKIFEIIEASNIFNIKINNLKILIHKNSYLHAIIKFNNGLSKLIIHDTDMKIPIFNTLYDNKKYDHKKNEIDISKLNNLDLKNPDSKKFPLIKLIKDIPNKLSLFNTVLVSINDTLVELFLENKINFKDISKLFISMINSKNLQKYKYMRVKSVKQIITLNKIIQMNIKSRYM